MVEAQETKKESEVQAYIQKLGFGARSYQALYLNFHLLEDNLLSQKGKQIVTDVFDSLLRSGEARFFSFANDDVLLVIPKNVKDAADSALVRIKFLLQDDETVQQASTLEESGIAVWYDLEKDYVDLLKREEIATKKDQEAEKNIQPSEKVVQRSENVSFFNSTGQKFKEKLTTEMLAKVQKIISVSDFSSFIRRQSICAIIGKSSPQRVFEEVFVSIPDMGESLLPNVDLTANPWLFLALTETLDRRVLELISRHDDGSLTGNFSVNINVSTILSDEFLHFDDTIGGSMRQTIVLELQLVDIFSDIRSFILAKTFAKARGYKICVDGITIDKLKYLNRSGLDCDLMKIVWHPSLVDVLSADEHFMDYMNKAERAKIILCRVDDAKAIEAGNSLGINLYQGRYVQSLLNASNTKR